MAINKRISDLDPQPIANYVASSGDLLAIVDVGNGITKRITKEYLMLYPGPIGLGSPAQAEFSAVTLDGYSIDGFSNDDTLADASVTEVPTEYAVKTYVDNAVAGIAILDIIHVSSDSTAVVGNSLLIDTASGDIDIELVADGTNEGRIDIKKVTTDSNIVHLSTSGIALIDGQPTNDDLNIGYGNISLLCDGINFYII